MMVIGRDFFAEPKDAIERRKRKRDMYLNISLLLVIPAFFVFVAVVVFLPYARGNQNLWLSISVVAVFALLWLWLESTSGRANDECADSNAIQHMEAMGKECNPVRSMVRDIAKQGRGPTIGEYRDACSRFSVWENDMREDQERQVVERFVRDNTQQCKWKNR
jgi:hypothetical protein